MQQLKPEEMQAVAVFKTSPEQQEELRAFMLEEGAEFGRQLSDAVTRQLSLKILLSNSGRCGAADIMAGRLRDEEKRLRGIGHDDYGVDLYLSAAKAELNWLGV